VMRCRRCPGPSPCPSPRTWWPTSWHCHT
jgi:hypothetical protein